MTDITESLAAAFDADDGTGTRIKASVVDVIAAADPSVSVEDTRYFNHSFIPDLVLSWAGQPGLDDRAVFLRPATDLEQFRFDLDHLTEDGPMFVALGRLRPEVQETREQARHRRCLITDPVGLDELASARTSAYAGLLPSLVLRGGEGVADESVAQQFVASGSAAFDAASTHDGALVVESVQGLQSLLGAAPLRQLTSFLRVLWGATGTEATFPIETDLTAVSDEILRYLLVDAEPLDAGFLRSLGSAVNLERLVGLGLPESPVQLAPFLAANADQLTARHMVVVRHQPTLGGSRRWELRGRSLAFAGENFRAYFSAAKSDSPNSEVHAPLTTREFLRRVRRAPVVGVTLSVQGESVSVTLAEGSSVDTSSTLDALATASAMVTSATLMVGGRTLLCDFVERDAQGNTSARFSLLELLQHGLRTVWDLSSPDSEFIADLGRLAASFSSHPTLDLEWDDL